MTRHTDEQWREAAREFVAQHGRDAMGDVRDAIVDELRALSTREPVSVEALRAELARLAREPALGWGALQASAHLATYARHAVARVEVVRTTEGDSLEYWSHWANMFPHTKLACHYTQQAQLSAGVA